MSIKNNKQFSNISGNFGFGMMRFYEHDGEYNSDEIKEMVDTFINAGFNYFDTAHVYMNGKSETYLRDLVVARYPRKDLIITNKLSTASFKKEEDIDTLFKEQLKLTGVDYFDFYLMHSMGRKSFKKYKKCRAFEHGIEYKKQGEIKHFGISFHDTSDVLEKILTEYPEIEVVQLQLNYLDMDDTAVQGRANLDVCNKFNKPVIVMEPIKGGSLIALPENAKDVIKQNFSANSDKEVKEIAANLALRYTTTLPSVFLTLSGMNELSQVKQNVKTFDALEPLNDTEKNVITQITEILNSLGQIRCTSCGYCVNGCPRHIDIPSIFSCYNRKIIMQNWNQDYYYRNVYTTKGRRASDCEKCGKCENICPQHLPIQKNLEMCAEIFDKDLAHH